MLKPQTYSQIQEKKIVKQVVTPAYSRISEKTSEITQKKKPVETRVCRIRGLNNIGNTCYMYFDFNEGTPSCSACSTCQSSTPSSRVKFSCSRRASFKLHFNTAVWLKSFCRVTVGRRSRRRGLKMQLEGRNAGF